MSPPQRRQVLSIRFNVLKSAQTYYLVGYTAGAGVTTSTAAA